MPGPALPCLPGYLPSVPWLVGLADFYMEGLGMSVQGCGRERQEPEEKAHPGLCPPPVLQCRCLLSTLVPHPGPSRVLTAVVKPWSLCLSLIQ